MKEEHISTLKSARYFTLGEPGYKTRTIWFVFHGYGQLASEMLSWFSGFESEERIIIAPEGFSRFYKKGFFGEIGASWMTKEDRETEIKDYTIFINNLYQHIVSGMNTAKLSVNLLGFSQGVATAFRVFADNKFKVDNLVLYCSPPPHDVDFKKIRILSAATDIKVLAGKNDVLVNLDKMKEGLKPLQDSKVNFEFLEFEGGHELNKQILNETGALF